MRSSLVSLARRRRRPLLWFAGLFTAFSLAGFLLAPVILKQQLIKHASAALHRPVAIDQVRVNPWTFSVTIRGLSVTDHDGSELAGWDEFYANFQSSSLFRWTWYFDTIRFTHPRGRLLVAADGTLNIADLIPPAAAPAPAAAASMRPPAVALAHFLVERGEFAFLDRSRSAPFETHLGPTSFVLQNFTTRPKQSGNYTFEAVTEAGERFAWRGALTFDPLGSAGHFEISGFALPKYSPFFRDFLRFGLTSGQLAVTADYEVSLAGEPVARLRNASATLTALKLAAPGATAPFLEVPEVRVENLAADSALRTASISRVLVHGASVTAERRADGAIDLVEFITPNLPASQPETRPALRSPGEGGNPKSETPFAATLGSLEIDNASLHLTDRTTPRPVSISIDQLGFTLTGAGTQLDREVSLTTKLRWNESGHIVVSGKVRPQPLAADLQVEAEGLALRPLDPYLAPFVDVLITGGTARAKGQLTFALAADGTPDLHWTGDAGLADFAAVDGAFSEPLFSFADLALTNIRATTKPLAVSLDEIALKQPFARAIVFADKQINLTAILKKPAAAQPSVSVPKPETQNPKPTIVVGRVTLVGARLTATDRSVEPAFTTELSDFGGTISGLSSEQLARADVDLTGRLGLAPLKISGKINPLSGDAFSDVKVTFTDIELPAFTPYSGRFAGYTIDKGKLSLDLSYHLSARELVAENNVILDQFYLGQPVASPDATKLPVKLALAILRDRDGRIPIDLPIRGNLDDPDFKYGKFVWHALGNLVVKAATAPFALLGGLFGGGHDLSAVDFASGSAELDPEALTRLDGLVKALTERPGLSLEISSQPQPELDLAGLRATQLEALLRARKLHELAASTTAAIDPATIQLTPEETARFLAELHTERCPAIAATPGAAAAGQTGAIAPAKPEPAKGNLIVRNVRRLFGRSENTASATATPKPGAHSAASTPSKDGTLAALTPEEMRTQILSTLTPATDDYLALAARRAQRIQEYLTGKGQVATARVFLAPGGVPPAAASATVPRVVFNLQ